MYVHYIIKDVCENTLSLSLYLMAAKSDLQVSVSNVEVV